MYPEVYQILYSITIFYVRYSLLTILHNFLNSEMGNSYWVLGAPYKKQLLIVPILAESFSRTETTKITKNQAAQKCYNGNDFV